MNNHTDQHRNTTDCKTIHKPKENTGITILRWLAILPASILGACLMHGVFVLFNDSGLWTKIIASAIFGGAFVYFAYLIAPSHKNNVATIFTGIIWMFTLLSLFNVIPNSAIGIIGAIVMSVSAGIVCKAAWNGEID